MLYGILSPSDLLPKSIGFFSFIPFFDKIVHLGMFAVFSFLLFWILVNKINFLKSILVTTFISVGFGIITELSQLLLSNITHRSFEFMDLFADILGIAFSMLLCSFIITKQEVYIKKTHIKQKKNR